MKRLNLKLPEILAALGGAVILALALQGAISAGANAFGILLVIAVVAVSGTVTILVLRAILPKILGGKDDH